MVAAVDQTLSLKALVGSQVEDTAYVGAATGLGMVHEGCAGSKASIEGAEAVCAWGSGDTLVERNRKAAIARRLEVDWVRACIQASSWVRV